MRTFGRVIGVLGLTLAAAGALGGLALQPPEGLGNAAVYLEDKRQAVRSKLPEMPPLGDLIAGTGGDEQGCDAGEDGAEASFAACEGAAPRVMSRRSGSGPASGGGGDRFRAPAPSQP